MSGLGMGMGVKGTLFVANSGESVRVYAVNHGDSPGYLTHNVRKDEADALNLNRVPQHKDHRYDHYNVVPPGRPEAPGVAQSEALAIGGQYRTETARTSSSLEIADEGVQHRGRLGRFAVRMLRGVVSTLFGKWGLSLLGRFRERTRANEWSVEEVRIEPGAWMRVGFRGRAFFVTQIPEAGRVIEIPYEQMLPQEGRAGIRGGDASGNATWDPTPMDRTGVPLPAQLQAMLLQREAHVVSGRALIEPKEDPRNPGRLLGWSVWFQNDARGVPMADRTHGFVGTVVLTNEEGNGTKNAGLGLESMPCPAGATKASQFIRANGDYGVTSHGVRAVPGTRIRLGVRGFSSHNDARLPSLSDGPLVIDLADFVRTRGQSEQNDWFDGTQMEAKLGEKKALVDMYRDGRRINDDLPDTIYTGDEARERAAFKTPPHVTIERVPCSEKLPRGGWRITMTSELPDADDLGPVGFTGQIKVAAFGRLVGDERVLPVYSFLPDSRTSTWIVPLGHRIADVTLRDQAELVIDTGALGWRGVVRLPGEDQSVDTSETLRDTWTLIESHYHRAKLYPPGLGPLDRLGPQDASR